MSLPILQLKKNEERRIKAGHLWVYSNEVDTNVSPLKAIEPGAQVQVLDSQGKFLGHAYFNAQSLICARIYSRNPKITLDTSLLVHRIQVALSLRELLFDKPFYRLVYGESDQLPGLVVDRFDDVLVAQITTLGMEQQKDAIIEALVKVLKPTAIYWRNDSSIREMEGLPIYNEAAYGPAPEMVELVENGVRFQAPVAGGQKTGWFYDHRMNRSRLQSYVKGKRVLDVFSYIGGWGIQAAAAGASDVLCVDSSAPALEQVHANAELNGLTDKVATLEGDAFAALAQLREQQESFDVVVVDPPAFIKRKKDYKQGLEAYRRINSLAMRLLAKDGILVSASCSHHMDEAGLLNLLQSNARHGDRFVQLLEQGFQGPDHPVHPAIPETRYIKCYTLRVLPAR